MNNEIRRILDGPAADESPSGMGLVEYRIHSDGDISAVMKRIRHALVMLVSVELVLDVSDSDTEMDEYQQWKHEEVDAYIGRQLVCWFVEDVDKGADMGDVKSSIRYFGDGRDWCWWNISQLNEHDALLQIEISGFPISGLDALRWLCSHCGGSSLEALASE